MFTINFEKTGLILKSLIINQINSIKNNKFCPVPFIQGPPGIGKSEWMKNFIENLQIKDYNFALEIKYLSTFPLEKLTGLPTPEYSESKSGKSFTKWTTPDLFKFENLYNYKADKNNIIILFLDDVHLVPKSMAPYLFEFYSYRTLHGYKLPDNVLIITAGNGPDDNAGYQPIPAPVISRYKFIYLECELDYWMKNYGHENVLPEINVFLQMNPDHFSIKPNKQDAYSCPRSWSALSEMIRVFKESNPNSKIDNIIRDFAIGTISESSAMEFENFYNNIYKWDGKKYLEGKEFPQFSNMKRLDMASCIVAIQQELMKEIRSHKDNEKVLEDQKIKTYINNFIKINKDLLDYLAPVVVIILQTIIKDKIIDEKIIDSLINQILEDEKIHNVLVDILGGI